MKPLNINKPWLIFLFIILLITTYFSLQGSEKTEKTILEKLIEQKKAIKEKVETLDEPEKLDE